MAGFLAKCQSVCLGDAARRSELGILFPASSSHHPRRFPSNSWLLGPPPSRGEAHAPREWSWRLSSAYGIRAWDGFLQLARYVRTAQFTDFFSPVPRTDCEQKKDLFLLVLRCHFLVSPQHRCRKANRVFFSLVGRCVCAFAFLKKGKENALESGFC